jgi:hypothetical protein
MSRLSLMMACMEPFGWTVRLQATSPSRPVHRRALSTCGSPPKSASCGPRWSFVDASARGRGEKGHPNLAGDTSASIATLVRVADCVSAEASGAAAGVAVVT